MIKSSEILDDNLKLCRDYSSLLQWSLSKISQFNPEWTDFTISDPGVIYLSNISYIYDNLNLLLDMNFNNQFLRHTEKFNTIYNMYQLAGLKIEPLTSTELTVNIVNNSNSTLNLSEGFYITTTLNDNNVFYLIENVSINAGTSRLVTFREGIFNILRLSRQSILNSFNKILIPIKYIANNSIIVNSEGLSDNWIKIEDVANYHKEDLRYSIKLVENEYLEINFINGWQSLTSANHIIIKFAVSSGNLNHMPISIIKSMNPIEVGMQDITNNIQFTHISSITGKDYRNIENLKYNIYNSYSNTDSLINFRDFKELSIKIPEVLSLFTQYINNIYYIYYIPRYDNFNAIDINNKILALIQDKNLMILDNIQVNPVTYNNFNITCIVYLNTNIHDTSVLYNKILNNLNNYINNLLIDDIIYISDIINMIESSDNTIKYAELIYPREDLYITPTNFFRLSNVDIQFRR